MSISEKKQYITDYLSKADDRFINMVVAMIEAYGTAQVIGYTIDGKPINIQDLQERVQAADKRISSGQFVTQEDIEREIEGWE